MDVEGLAEVRVLLLRDRAPRMSRISILQARRALQVTLGVVWLLDAALQFQPFMFGRGFAAEILKPTAAGNPSLVARPVLWSAQIVLAHPQFWNTVFALTQLLLGLALFWRRSVKVALAGTVVWSLLVWWLGEGLGGVLAGSATPLMGAPGAVILYALLALLLWPAAADDNGCSLADSSILSRVAPLAWILVWAGEAYFALLPANDSPAAMQGMLAGMADGEPQVIASLDRSLAHLAAHNGIIGPGLGALFALCALAVLLPPRFAKPLYGLAMVLAAITWLGQDFGGILTGQGTDPNSGPLLFLLALVYWPIREPAAAPAATATRRPLLRTGIATAVAALVTASSVAAATGLTTATAGASPGHQTLTLTSTKMLGPGPILYRHQIASDHLILRDSANRASHPGLISVQLSRHDRPLNDARLTVTYHSLDMHMPNQTLTLHNRGQGQYNRTGPRLSMGGRWQIRVSIHPRSGPALQLSMTDLIAS
jgi:hypothetical protein